MGLQKLDPTHIEHTWTWNKSGHFKPWPNSLRTIQYSAISAENSLQGEEEEHSQTGPDGEGNEP
jgi:hypothetical protein